MYQNWNQRIPIETITIFVLTHCIRLPYDYGELFELGESLVVVTIFVGQALYCQRYSNLGLGNGNYYSDIDDHDLQEETVRYKRIQDCYFVVG